MQPNQQPVVAVVVADGVPTVRSDTPAERVAALLAEHQLSAVPVVDSEHVLVGAISLVDLLAPADGDPIFAGLDRRRWYQHTDGVTAADLMTPAARAVAFGRALPTTAQPPHEYAAAS